MNSSENNEVANLFLELLEILRKLRAPGGCSWDQAQTSQSLIPYLLEETHEIIEAIETNNINALKEELGDLLLHIIFQAELARESKQFNIADSLQNVIRKLVKRHPNVFNDNVVNVNDSWEVSKQKEKNRKNILDGVPKTLPALLRARRIQEKAASVNFDWKDINPVLNKVDEELSELKEAIIKKNTEMIKDELGDLLFSLVNLSRFLDIDPESSLRGTISKFENRFSKVEDELKKRGKSFSESSFKEMDEIWNIIKKSP